eukprot:TRINITY_DN130_c0_g1_i11.p1 TRINITY_DN130_c0_g1~~TRINITY_DN130_c0_g1_i11.p1  ORF type:complete len:288 (+),score=21.83 TRINITY_DN130_c0_g1_i11:653-1516(+)
MADVLVLLRTIYKTLLCRLEVRTLEEWEGRVAAMRAAIAPFRANFDAHTDASDAYFAQSAPALDKRQWRKENPMFSAEMVSDLERIVEVQDELVRIVFAQLHELKGSVQDFCLSIRPGSWTQDINENAHRMLRAGDANNAPDMHVCDMRAAADKERRLVVMRSGAVSEEVDNTARAILRWKGSSSRSTRQVCASFPRSCPEQLVLLHGLRVRRSAPITQRESTATPHSPTLIWTSLSDACTRSLSGGSTYLVPQSAPGDAPRGLLRSLLCACTRSSIATHCVVRRGR